MYNKKKRKKKQLKSLLIDENSNLTVIDIHIYTYILNKEGKVTIGL